MPERAIEPSLFPTPVARALKAVVDPALPFVQRFPNIFATAQQLMRFSGILMISEYVSRPPSRTDPKFTRFFANLRTPTFGTWAALAEHFRNLTAAEQAELPATVELGSAYLNARGNIRKLIEVRNERYGHRNIAPDENETADLYARYFPELKAVLRHFGVLQKAVPYCRLKSDLDSVYACMGPEPGREPAVSLLAEVHGAFEACAFICLFDSRFVIPLYPFFEIEVRARDDLAPLLFDGWKHRAIVYMGDAYRRALAGSYQSVAATLKSHHVPFPEVPFGEVFLSALSGYANESSRRNIEMLRNKKYFPSAYVAREGVDDRIEQFLESGSQPALLILSKAGMGKTSLLCRFADKYLANRGLPEGCGPDNETSSGEVTVVFVNLTNLHENLWEATRRQMGLTGNDAQGFPDLLHCWSKLVAQEKQVRPKLLFIFDALDECGNLEAVLREVSAVVREAGALNQKPETLNAVKVILSVRKLDFERSREAIGAAQLRSFHIFGEYTDPGFEIELEPFTEQQSTEAFVRLGGILTERLPGEHRHDWDFLPPTIRSLLREPLFIWMYHTVFPHGSSAAGLTEVTERDLWAGFYEHALREENGFCPPPSSTRSSFLHRFFVERLMAFCDQADSLVITSEIIDNVKRMAEQERKVGRPGIVPFDLLESRSLLLRKEHEDLDSLSIRLSYSFVHRSVAEQALCIYFKENRRRYPAIDADFFHRQTRRLGSFEGLRGALTILLEELWYQKDFTVWWEGLAHFKARNWASLLTEALTTIIRRHIGRAGAGVFSTERGSLQEVWREWIGGERIKDFRTELILLAEGVFCNRLNKQFQSHSAQIPLMENLLDSVIRGKPPLDSEAAVACANLKTKLAEAYSLIGNATSAEKLLSEAIEPLAHYLAGPDKGAPGGFRYGRVLAKAYSTLSRILKSAGRRAEAERLQTKSYEILETLSDTGAANAELELDLASEMALLADLCHDKAEREKAVLQARRALLIQEKLFESGVYDTRARAAAAKSCLRLSRYAFETGNRAEGLARCKKAIELYEHVVSIDADDLSHQRGLAAGFRRLSQHWHQTGARDLAVEYCRKALKITGRLASIDPDTLGHHLAQSRNLAELAHLHYEVGEYDEALELSRDSLSVREKLAVFNPKDLGILQELADAYGLLTKLYRAAGDRGSAIEYCRKALRAQKRLFKTDQSNIRYQKGLASAYAVLGLLHGEKGKVDKLLKMRHTALKMIRRVAETDKRNLDYQNRLAATCGALSQVLREYGQWDQAIEYRRQCLDILEGVTAADPANNKYRFYLAFSYWAFGWLMVDKNRLGEARQYCEKAHMNFERILAVDSRCLRFRKGLNDARALDKLLSECSGETGAGAIPSKNDPRRIPTSCVFMGAYPPLETEQFSLVPEAVMATIEALEDRQFPRDVKPPAAARTTKPSIPAHRAPAEAPHADEGHLSGFPPSPGAVLPAGKPLPSGQGKGPPIAS